MVRRQNFKCAKCGITWKEDSSLTFHRFPVPSSMHGSLKARVWAKYCFPDGDWTSDESLKRLHAEHKMLCGNHFDDSSFTSSDRKRLNKFSIPVDAQNILSQLRNEQCNTPKEVQSIQYQESEIEMKVEAMAGTSQHATSMETQNTDLTRGSQKKTGILKELNIKKCTELSPRKMKLYKRCRKNLSEIIRLRRRLQQTNKCNRSILTTLSSNTSVNEMMKSKLSSSFYLLLQSQIKNAPRKLAGRRWTLDDKVLALSIYKKSSSCYRILSRLFCLPSVSSLKALLNRIPMVCGINDQVLQTIKEITKSRAVEDNLCVLAFDEMSIRKSITYNSKLDQFDGYQDHGSQGRTSEIATHALTFMAIGIRKQWKQPIAFYFSGACVTADRLAVLIKEVLCACFCTGLEVVGTICDLDGVNIRAINNLGSSRDQPYFNYMGHEIVTILDPPHLLKCFRNNFFKHDIQFTQDLQIEGNQIQGIAKWSHIETFFYKDRENPNFVFAPALTQQHLQPNGKQKMKVRLAAQVLSHSVAAGIFAKVAQNELPQEAIATATVISLMDKLFDCMNGDTPDRKRGKHYLTNMSPTSPHLTFFKKMKLFFTHMKFLGARSNPPSQDGWLRTLNALEMIYNNLKKYNVHTLSVRRLNQDPLENCFGCIRSNCGCNPNPTSVQFIAALKTSIVTNLINNNKNRNCLDDKNDLLNDFKLFLSNKNQNPSTFSTDDCITGTVEEITCNYHPEQIDMPQCSGEMQACAYVCGYITKKMAFSCNLCKNIMLANPNTEVCHLFTSFKEYDDLKLSLNYVQTSFCQMVENAATLINNYLKENAHKEKVKVHLNEICKRINKDWLKGCPEHCEKNFEIIIESTIAICIKRFAKVKNQDFAEEVSKRLLSRKINILKHV